MATKKTVITEKKAFHSAFFPKEPVIEKRDTRRLAMNANYVRPQTLSSSIERILIHNGISPEGFEALTGCEFDYDDERSIEESIFTDEEFFDDGERITDYVESEPKVVKPSKEGLSVDNNVLGQVEEHGGTTSTEVPDRGSKNDGADSEAPSRS